MKTKVKVLTLSSHYLPGYKAGGPIRTISNMVSQLSDDFEFYIVTRDRDLGANLAYPIVKPNEWNNVGKGRVFYASPEKLTVRNISNLIQDSPADVLYLNSFFDPTFTIKPLLSRLLGWNKGIPIIIAPRGEFSTAALALKSFKKRLFIKFTQSVGLYKNVRWQASSEFEKKDIISALGVNEGSVFIAKDLPAKKANNIKLIRRKQDNSELAMVFLSRISPMKNLNYALKVLQKVKVPVLFDIYGPQKDKSYWALCKVLIEKLPSNVNVNYCGVAEPSEVAGIFSQHDLFFFPTCGENYGHVVAESLSVGTPVLMSDQTPWRNLEKDGLGWDLSLDNMERFVDIIELYALRNVSEKDEIRSHVQSKAVERLADPCVLESNRQLFYRCLNK